MSECTELVPVVAEYPPLARQGDVAECLTSLDIPGMEPQEQDLLTAKVPSSGQTTWIVPSYGGEPEAAKAITGVLVDFAYRGFLWPFEEPGKEPPVLLTHDGIKAYKMSDELGDLDPDTIAEMAVYDDDGKVSHYDWTTARNPYAKFGSASNGRGKRIQEKMRLLVLRPGSNLPLQVNVPVGSFANVRQGITMACRDAGKPFYQAIVELTLESDTNAVGQDYSKIVARITGWLPDEAKPTVLAMRKAFASPDPSTRAAADLAVREANGERAKKVRDDFVPDDVPF